jgi:hypothetical protein
VWSSGDNLATPQSIYDGIVQDILKINEATQEKRVNRLQKQFGLSE